MAARGSGDHARTTARHGARSRRRAPARGSSGVQLGEDAARATILRGGAIVFAADGARAASVARILQEAGVARRTFYRLYAGKEDVMAALYHAGTEMLLDRCREAVRAEHDPLRRVERCIDVHLGHARDLGRLVWVLGSEAQHHESPLRARRLEVHAALAALLEAADAAPGRARVDPMLPRALVLALEGVTRIMLEESDEGRAVTAARLARTRRVMLRIATATLAGTGAGVAALPTADATGRRPDRGAPDRPPLS
ncbi:MAG: TetR/AcrR family transcriptional regulator [bacterium]|nr:TetR/AcrR family transcriptional regulator [bacterium]